MASPSAPTTRAVLLDALGTLVELEPPWDHLAVALGLAPEDVAPAVRAEMDYYREHSHEGTDSDSLAALRARCADILSWELDREVPVDVMMDSIRFNAFADAAPALAALRDDGITLVCVSNWDCSLPEVLEGCGLGGAVDGIVTSAAVGAQKPDPAIFQAALEMAGCSADEAVHVGDTVAEDIAGAGAIGIRALLIDRAGGGDLASLEGISSALAPG